MTPGQWEQVQDLFARAVELDPGERESLLDEACAGDPRLRREVESLLAADAEDDGGFDEPIVRLREPPELLGRRIGPYRVLREIGRGGLGSVFLAAREDDFEHRVAIKLIKRGMDTDEVVRRFHRERQVLANLVHPYVARLLDGGSTDDGRPYFVMELVDGVHLDRYCKDRELSLEERLRLFLEVCSAVQYAHGNLVVHRDLKPGNILVSGGIPKLLDFGIAKLLAPEGGTALTRRDSAPMTPEYASPEQARGEAITTASDVYSLGVVLYELITGCRPYRLDGCTHEEGTRRICEAEPKKPSSVVRSLENAAAGRRRLAGDLDSIVLQALHKEPERRYGSVDQLAEDLRRYLDGQPVRAHQGNRFYRVGKFVRRYRVAVAMTAVLLFAGLAAAVGWYRAVSERDRAEAERRRAERVTELLVDVFEAPDPDRAKGREPTARELLGAGRAKVLAGLEAEPEVRAALLQAMGRVYRRLGDYGEGRNLLEEALRLRQETLGPNHPRVAESLHDLAHVLRRQGELAAAGPLFEEAVAIQRHNAAELPLELARGLTNLSQLRYDENRYEEAEAVLREALEIKRRAPGTTDEDMAVTLSNLAVIRKMLGRPRESVDLYREVLEIRRRTYGPLHTGVARSLDNLAAVLRDLGELREAESLLREALEIRLELQGAEHPEVAVTRRRLGTVLEARGELEGAADEYQKALDVQLATLGEGHPEIALTWTRQAAVLAGQGEPARCELLAREAISLLRRVRPDSWHVADAESVLGGCLAGLGRRSEAEPLLRESYGRLRQVRGEGALATREAAQRLAALR